MTKEGLRQRPCIHSADTQIEKKYSQACSKLHSLCLERCVCVCVCVCERERQREREADCFPLRVSKTLGIFGSIKLRDRKKKAGEIDGEKKKTCLSFFYFCTCVNHQSHTQTQCWSCVYTYAPHTYIRTHSCTQWWWDFFFFAHHNMICISASENCIRMELSKCLWGVCVCVCVRVAGRGVRKQD